MPHLRKRFLEPLISKALAWSPAVGLFGLRQVGKSTLVEGVNSQKGGDYETFDNSTTLAAAQNRPQSFCTRSHLLCIDESQKGENVFSVIKNLIGTKRKPGRFLLTGSIKFTLKKEIREALTGRILLFELLPFAIAETLHCTSSHFLKTCFDAVERITNEKTTTFDTLLKQVQEGATTRRIGFKQVTRYLTLGGMPIPCFTRDAFTRNLWYQSFFETLITRDLALADKTLMGLGLNQGLSFLKGMSLMQGQELNYAHLAQQASLSLAKTKKMIAALVALCLIDLVVPEQHAAKSQKKMRLEWKDVGLWNHFSQANPAMLYDNQTALGLILSQELRFQTAMLEKATLQTHYRSHNGASIPWIFRQGDRVIAITYLPTENPSPMDYRALKQFLAHEKNGIGIILGPETASYCELNEGILLMPLTAVF